MRFLFKTVLRPGHPPLPRRCRLPLVRPARRRLLLAAAVLMADYYVGEITWVFIYGICGVSLMLLAGYTGLV